jgi:phosphatidylserine/phosphatidylglycerophosphate/cardiolipin synthase-like enzyme
VAVTRLEADAMGEVRDQPLDVDASLAARLDLVRVPVVRQRDRSKCAAADEADLLISSANLTEFALNMNMELGVRVRGGDLPNRVVEHLRRLMQYQVLVPLQKPLR